MRDLLLIALAACAADPSPASAQEPTAEAWIPMELYLSSYIYLRGSLNGVETDLVLDSGAGSTVVDAAVAERLGLAEGGSVLAQGAGGTQSASFLDDVEIVVGAVTLAIPQPVKIDLSGVETMLGRAMPVILGKDVFDGYVVDIDYPRSRVAFRSKEDFAYDGPGQTVPFVPWSQGKLVIEAGVEDLPPAHFAVDTGSGQAVDLFADFTAEHELLDERSPQSARLAGGVGASFVSKVATLRSFTLAGHRLHAVPAGFADVEEGAFGDDGLAGNLGAGLFSRFRLIFDCSRSRLHVEPGPEWETRPFRKDRLGLSAKFRDGAIEIMFVAPGSPAEKAGWEPGQRISALNGERVSADSWRAALARCANVAAGTEVRLTDGAGRERKLVAAEYY